MGALQIPSRWVALSGEWRRTDGCARADFGAVGNIFDAVASNLIAGECVNENERVEGAGLKTRHYHRRKRAGLPTRSGQVPPASMGWVAWSCGSKG